MFEIRQYLPGHRLVALVTSTFDAGLSSIYTALFKTITKTALQLLFHLPCRHCNYVILTCIFRLSNDL